MIYLESRDSYIWNLNDHLIEIIKEAITTDNKISFSLNHEGPCLRSCNLYEFLDKICATFNINKSRFEIYTSNIEESHNEYKIIFTNNYWVSECKQHNAIAEIKRLKLFTVGCFIGKLNWSRLALLSWIDQYPTQSLVTCHFDASSQTHQSALQLTEIMNTLPDEISCVANFLKTCPRQINNYNIAYDENGKNMTFSEIGAITANFADGYADIFSELVCETYFTGLTFFPTEKTFRPIQQLTPFITMGPVGFLGNLRRCGFKTFSDYWDESYDNYSAVERIIKIRAVLTQLFNYDQATLQQMYLEMLPILKHNKERMSKLTSKDLLLDE